jgi:signal transduction histidine kinase
MRVGTNQEVSRHKCLIYDGDPSEQLPVVVPLLLDGLRENWRCLYLGSPDALRMVETALVTRGVDFAEEIDRGALVLSSDRSHLTEGAFDPDAMVDSLRAAIDEATSSGFDGLCATGDMRWELGDDINFDRLLEYEAKLDRVFRDKPLRGICQYHRALVPERALRDALLTHPAAFVGDSLNRDNLFYLPPELLLDEPDAKQKQGEWMCSQIVRVLDAERERDGVMAALRESEAAQRQLAEQLAAANRDLERRVAERTAELQVANRQLEAFSYSVSHDLRAPLRAIAGFGAALRDEHGAALGEEGRQDLERLLGGATRMSALIEDMLALSRVVNVEVRRLPVDLTALAQDVARELGVIAPTRVVIEPDLHATGDPSLLRAVMTNLIDNALKFSARQAQPRVHVGGAGEEGGMPVFFVRDNGAGFDMRFADKLFGAFQRLHRQDEFPGTGVGLATVERIVSRHRGRIWAKSTPGQGATFFFTLPR